MSDKENKVVVCRCEEITQEEIRAWIDRGYDSFDELKRVLRVGMGPCQGRGCQDIIIREIAHKTGIPVDKVDAGTTRPPVKPIKTCLIATGGGD